MHLEVVLEFAARRAPGFDLRSHAATYLRRRSLTHSALAPGRRAHGTERVLAAVKALFKRGPAALCRIPTRHQSFEMAQRALLDDAARIAPYFAEMRAPWQHPANANRDVLLCRYAGKSSTLAANSAANSEPSSTA